MNFIWVKWRDAAFQRNEAHEDDFDPDYIVETTGFLAKKDDKFISVAQDYISTDGRWRCITHIPLNYILKKKTIKLGGTFG